MLNLRLWSSWIKEMGAVALVSVGVALVFTFVASVFDQFHQVAAEDLGSNEVAALAGADNTQVLRLDQWGVSLTLPLGSDMAVVKYAAEGPDSVGLSSAAVEKIASVCTASHNAVGVIVRAPAGAQLNTKQALAQGETSLGSIGGYTYMYERPDSSCEATRASVLASAEAIGIAGAAVLSAQ
jgi:hypothetical protein